MAAHNFENLLQVCRRHAFIISSSLLRMQCAIPVFDGLLPEPHNKVVLKLLFDLAHWHGLAKLRLHNDLTLKLMEAATISLGKKLRDFSQNTCPSFETRELHREYDARIRRESKKAASKRPQAPDAHAHAADVLSSINQPSNPEIFPTQSTDEQHQPISGINEANNALVSTKSKGTGRRYKTFNLSTYKLHSLGDYVDTIRNYGTTDSFSTEPVCGTTLILFKAANRLPGRTGTSVAQGQIHPHQS